MKTLFKERKAQAAVTDALFFLTIVAVVSVLLFTNAMSYGKDLMSSSVQYYESTYTISAMKSLYAISVPLGQDQYNSLENSYNDGLISILKKDYYFDNILSLSTQLKVMESLKQIMAPISKNKNHLFYIYVPQNSQGIGEVVFTGLSTYKEKSENETSSEKIIYLCGPNEIKQLSITIDQIQEYLKIHMLGQSFSEGRMSLLYTKDGSDMLYIASTGLVSWTATHDLDLGGNPINPIVEAIFANCCFYLENDEQSMKDVASTCPTTP
jgi:hypothetical protein